MKKQTNYSAQNFEFLFKINGNIIIQRYFNVEGYNDKVLTSIELKELMDSLCGMNNGSFGSCGIIPKYLKDKSVDYVWDRYDPYSETRREEDASEKELFKNEDVYTFELKVHKKLVAKSIFSGNWFPTAVRYQVNIKPIVPNIIEEISEFFTRNEYEAIAQ